MIKKNYVACLILVLVTILILVPGCRVIQRPAPQTPVPPTVPPGQTPLPQTPAPEIPREQRQENMRGIRVAEEIEKLVEDVPGVEEAYVVLLGRTMWIGLETEREQPNAQIKEDVQRVARDRYPDYEEYLVGTDRNTVDQLRTITEDIRRGRVAEDFRDVLDRLANTIRREPR